MAYIPQEPVPCITMLPEFLAHEPSSALIPLVSDPHAVMSPLLKRVEPPVAYMPWEPVSLVVIEPMFLA